MSEYTTSVPSNLRDPIGPQVHPIEKPTFYSSPHTLLRWRYVLHGILFANVISRVFVDGPVAKAEEFYFFTVWTETCIWFYFFLVIFVRPFNHEKNGILVDLQHAFLLQETIVVSVFWGVLFPYLGLGKNHDSYFQYIEVYKHTIPFLSIFLDFLTSHGEYSHRGVYICIIIYVVYFAFMNFNHFVFDITPYPTPLTDCKTWKTYAVFVVTFPIFYYVGKAFTACKRKITGKKKDPKEIVDDEEEGTDNYNKYN